MRDRTWPEPNDEADGAGLRVRPRLVRIAAAHPPWMGYAGRWGGARAGWVPGETDSPRGPAFQPQGRWSDPDAWARAARPCTRRDCDQLGECDERETAIAGFRRRSGCCWRFTGCGARGGGAARAGGGLSGSLVRPLSVYGCAVMGRVRLDEDAKRMYVMHLRPRVAGEPTAQAATRCPDTCQGVRIRGPSSVIATVNSKCAASEPSWE